MPQRRQGRKQSVDDMVTLQGKNGLRGAGHILGLRRVPGTSCQVRAFGFAHEEIQEQARVQ